MEKVQDENKCGICMDYLFDEGKNEIALKPCGHVYCLDCI
jgi:hypothetical protein